MAPEGLKIVFPALRTPETDEVAKLLQTGVQAVINAFQAGLIRADTAMKELKRLSEDTGMFGTITDEEIKANEGRTYQDVTALRDPLAGLGFEGGLE
jgi:hypothetical protein